MGRVVARLLTLLAMLVCCSIARAQEGLPKVPPQPWLLGDWGGLRTRLYDKGVDFQLSHVSESAYNPVGGAKSLVDYTDQVGVGARLDLEKLITLPNSQLQVTYTERAGRNLSQDAGLNTQQLVQEVWGRGQTVRLTELYLQHSFFHGLFDVRWGRMTVGADFADFSCEFQNLTFCGSPLGNLVGNYIFNWPISQWAARARLNLEGFGYIKVGVFDQNQQYLGFDNKLWPVWYSGSTGVLLPIEFAWLPTFGQGNLPGSYKMGAWFQTGKANDVVLDVNGTYSALTGLPPMQRQGQYGGYLTFQQQLTRNASENPKGGWNVFLNGVFADAATSATNFQVASRLHLHGAVQLAAGRLDRLRRRRDPRERPADLRSESAERRRPGACAGPVSRARSRTLLHDRAETGAEHPPQHPVHLHTRRESRESEHARAGPQDRHHLLITNLGGGTP